MRMSLDGCREEVVVRAENRSKVGEAQKGPWSEDRITESRARVLVGGHVLIRVHSVE